MTILVFRKEELSEAIVRNCFEASVDFWSACVHSQNEMWPMEKTLEGPMGFFLCKQSVHLFSSKTSAASLKHKRIQLPFSHFVFCAVLWLSIKAYGFNSDPVIPTSTVFWGTAVWLTVSIHINATTFCLFSSQRVYFLLRTSILKKP